jgi:cyclopropane fatty-acyl-phospholipid synthase-like methyltransferase
MLKRMRFSLRYMGDPPWETGISPPELMAFINSHAPGRALDLGCGTGTNAITLAQHGWQVTGVDFVGRALKAARDKARHAGVTIEFLRQDASRLDNLQPPFDLALDIGCYHNLDETSQARYLANLQRLLAPNGVFLLYGILRKSERSEFGLSESGLQRLKQSLTLVQRVDGSERGQFSSAWFTFHR